MTKMLLLNINKAWKRKGYLFCLQLKYVISLASKHLIIRLRQMYLHIFTLLHLEIDLENMNNTFIAKLKTWISFGDYFFFLIKTLYPYPCPYAWLAVWWEMTSHDIAWLAVNMLNIFCTFVLIRYSQMRH